MFLSLFISLSLSVIFFFLAGKSLTNRPLERQTNWDNYVTLPVREIGCENMDVTALS
jgi:hypothetical protein